MSQPLLGLASSRCVPPDRSSGSPSPGRSQLTTTSPMTSANVVTISKYSSALPPIRPTAFRSPVCAMPTTIVENSSGTISPLMSEMNAFEVNRNNWYARGN